MSRKKNTQWLVFTDMDGSLLDHFSYQFDEAKESLNTLYKQKIPVIPVTSKTQAELELLREDLKNDHPFIIENGAAVFIPKGYFIKQPIDTTETDKYWIKSFVKPRETWQLLISKIRSRYQGKFKTFAETGLDDIMKMTGLNSDHASRAVQRQYGNLYLGKVIAWIKLTLLKI